MTMTRRERDAMRPMAHPKGSATLGLCGFVVVGLFGVLAGRSSAWTGRETAALESIRSMRTPVCTFLAKRIAWLFGPVSAIVLTALTAAVVWTLTRSWRRSLLLMTVVAGGWGATGLMKTLVQRPRPELAHPIVATPVTFSYPSGHTAFACSLVIAVLLTVRNWRHRPMAVAAGSILVVIVAASRVYLGVHYPTDVAAAVLLTVASAALLVPLLLNLAIPRLDRHSHIAVASSIDRVD